MGETVSDLERRRDIDLGVGKPEHQLARRVFGFRKGGCAEAQRLIGRIVEQWQGKVFQLRYLAARRARQRAERRNGGPEKPLGLSRFHPHRDMPEVRR